MMGAHDRERRRFGAAAAIAAGVSVLIAPASASEYCVTCEGPAAMYACVVSGVAPDAPPNPREQLQCISEIAKSGGHESCSVPRSAPKPCPGVLKIVAAPPPLPAAAEHVPPPEPAPPEPTGVGAAAPVQPEPPVDQGPKTMEDLAKKSVETSKENLEKAGEQVGKAGSAVGSAAKKTWDCVLSLFSDC